MPSRRDTGARSRRVVLGRSEGLTWRQIGERLGIPDERARRREPEVMDKLRREFAGFDPEAFF